MVKGISRQVIVMQSPDPELFEQAIFILKDAAVSKGVTEETLMREARQLVRDGKYDRRKMHQMRECLWAFAGAAVTGAVWLLFALI